MKFVYQIISQKIFNSTNDGFPKLIHCTCQMECSIFVYSLFVALFKRKMEETLRIHTWKAFERRFT